jgi:hypothetical protein
MKKTFILFTAIMLMAFFAQSQTTRQYSAGEVTSLLKDLVTAKNGDVFELSTSGGIYKIDTMSLEVHANITIKAVPGLAERPIIKMVQSGYSNQVDYLVRLVGEDVSLTLQGLEFQGDTTATKYAIRTAKVSDFGKFSGYDDTAYDMKPVQQYDLIIKDCVIDGIKKGSDGRGIILYPGTLARKILIENTTFSQTERDGIDAYLDTKRLNAHGHWRFVEDMTLENCTFYNIGRQAIQIRSSDTSSVSAKNKVEINHVTFDSCAWNNSDPGKYHTLKLDNVETTVTNSIFTDDVSDDYIFKLYNLYSAVNFIGVYNLGNGFGMKDTIVTARGKVSSIPNFWAENPKYANRMKADFTLSLDSPFLGKASDGKALGDLRWDPTNACLQEIAVDGKDVENFNPDTTTYKVVLPAGTTTVPEVFAKANGFGASINITMGTTLPDTAIINVTAKDGISTKSYSVIMSVESSTSVKSFSQPYLNIYPNPSTDGDFTIHDAEGANVMVYDATGKMIYNMNNISNDQRLQTGLSKGVYFISIQQTAKQKPVIRKLVVE